jgi:hypothetical protein
VLLQTRQIVLDFEQVMTLRTAVYDFPQIVLARAASSALKPGTISSG